MSLAFDFEAQWPVSTRHHARGSALPGLLFLSQRIPYPPNKGEKIRAYQILKYLTRHFSVHLGCLVDDPLDVPHEAVVAAMCASSHFAHLTRSRARWRCLSGLLTGEPLSVTFYRDAGLLNWVRDVVARLKPEVIFVYSSNMAPYILDLRANVPRVVVDLVDVDSEKWRAYAETGQGPMRFVHRREWHKMAALEARIARECDWCSFVSDDEAALFAQGNPGVEGKMRGISNGVDQLYFDPSLPFEPLFATDRANFVFTGTMDYPPNIAAVRWFAEDILPAIQARVPDAQFHIVGASPTPEVMALAGLVGVFVTGRVADVRPYLAHATAAVAPMRIGRGIQNKVLEAMAMARPVIVTTDALVGIGAIPNVEVLLADHTADFVDRCVQVAENGASGIGQAARARVLADFVWAQRLSGFDKLLGISAP